MLQMDLSRPCGWGRLCWMNSHLYHWLLFLQQGAGDPLLPSMILQCCLLRKLNIVFNLKETYSKGFLFITEHILKRWFSARDDVLITDTELKTVPGSVNMPLLEIAYAIIIVFFSLFSNLWIRKQLSSLLWAKRPVVLNVFSSSQL